MYVFATETVVVRHGGYPQRIVKGYAYRSDDPIVLAHPGNFQSDPVLRSHSDGWSPDVEQATAAPGERRTVKRGA